LEDFSKVWNSDLEQFLCLSFHWLQNKDNTRLASLLWILGMTHRTCLAQWTTLLVKNFRSHYPIRWEWDRSSVFFCSRSLGTLPISWTLSISLWGWLPTTRNRNHFPNNFLWPLKLALTIQGRE
jgi:hypothetical protein